VPWKICASPRGWNGLVVDEKQALQVLRRWDWKGERQLACQVSVQRAAASGIVKIAGEQMLPCGYWTSRCRHWMWRAVGLMQE